MTERPLTVLVAGGSAPSGIAVARALAQAGVTVYTVGSDSTRIAAAAEAAGSGVTPLTCDLASLPAVRELHEELTRTAGRIDGVIHLVGGWRGARDITGQSDEDWDFLESSSVTTLRNITRVFYDDLVASETGRFAMVSSTFVTAPSAAAASYAAVKAAAEAWTMFKDLWQYTSPASTSYGFMQEQLLTGEVWVAWDHTARLDQLQGAKQGQGEPELPGEPELHSAAVVLVVKALVDPGMRIRQPERRFPGYTDVEDLAATVVGLFAKPAAELNGQRILLTR